MKTTSQSYGHELRSYLVGLVLAVLLTAAAFALTLLKVASPTTTLTLVFTLGLIQVLVHFRFFLHIDFSRRSRPTLLLLLFSAVIILLMVGGTLIILLNLHERMM